MTHLRKMMLEELQVVITPIVQRTAMCARLRHSPSTSENRRTNSVPTTFAVVPARLAVSQEAAPAAEGLSLEEVAQLINAAGNLQQRALLMILYGTGMRRAEVSRLKVTDVDSQRMILRVERGKGGHDRDLPLSPALLETLREYWRWKQPRTYLFPSGDRQRGKDQPMSDTVGVIIGVGGALALTRFISSEIWHVKAADPETFAAVTVLLISVAIFACLLPTRRAVQVDPIHALTSRLSKRSNLCTPLAASRTFPFLYLIV